MTDQPVVRAVERQLLNAETVARILDVDISTVRKMIADGRLPSVRIEGMTTRRVPWAMLQAWIRDLIKQEAEKGQG
jgi:excisionase family DNA binding protein